MRLVVFMEKWNVPRFQRNYWDMFARNQGLTIWCAQQCVCLQLRTW